MATSRLQRYVSRELGKFMSEFLIYENRRYDWLDGKELDFYMPEIKTAIEVQGDQHYSYSPHFHKSYDGFLLQQKRDEDKRALCIANGVDLREVITETDADVLVATLFRKHHKISDDPIRTLVRDYKPPQEVKTKNISAWLIAKAGLIKRNIAKYNAGLTVGLDRLNKDMATLLRGCEREGAEIIDEDILGYYAKNAEEIYRRNQIYLARREREISRKAASS